MMKKLMVLCVVLALTSVASAASIWMEVAQPMDSYAPSSILTINVMGSGFASDPSQPYWDSLSNFDVGSITSNNGGVASNIQLHPEFDAEFSTKGDIGDGNPTLISGVGLATATSDLDGIPNGEVIYSFDYHVPELPNSSIIEIMMNDVTVSSAFFSAVDIDAIAPLSVHVPEPMTLGLLGLGGLFLRKRKK